MGKRLGELTHNNTKCMVKVNGVTLIDRMLHQIDKENLSRIIIVVGYEGQKLIDYVQTLNIKTPISFVSNPIYDKTNNIYSLALAKDYMLEDDTILFESDLIFEDSVLDVLLDDPRKTLALVDKYESWMDGTCVKLGEDDTIEAFVPGKKFKFNEIKDYYKTVNLYKFSKEFSETYYVPFLDAYQSALGENEYYEQVLRVITMLDDPVIKAKRLSGQKWYEIDDIQDLDIAESIFTPDDDEKVNLMKHRFGGFWRYPKLLDFCYMPNPYFPPKKMMDEMRANFDTMLTECPSGMRVNSLLAAKDFGVHQNNIVIGNGASELIKTLMEHFEGKVGFIRPTFEEYPNRYDKELSVFYTADNIDFSYTADDLISYFSDKGLEGLILINPDNPSGNFIPKEGLMRLIDWAGSNNIKLVVDESFVDFADAEDSTLLKQDIIDANPHLYVIKSISKSYGVPGLRLGVLATGNKEIIAVMKKEVPIWNINSFAEFYMQIEEKYKKDYKESLKKIRLERSRFQHELSMIKGLRVTPSQANFIMVEVEQGISTDDLLKILLVKHNILIKELSSKTNGRNYLRIAVRTAEDNDIFVAAMKEVLGADRG